MRPFARSRRSRFIVVFAVMALTLAAMVASNAATPGSGSVGPGATTTSWTGPTQTAVTNGPSDCASANAFCDDYTLTVNVPAGFYSDHSGGVTIELSTTIPANDFDLYVYANPQHTVEVDHAATEGTLDESLFIPSAAGPYYVRVVYFAVANSGYDGTATFSSQAGGSTGGAVFSNTQVAFAPATIVSANFVAGEPQVTMERPTSDAQPGAINQNRIFADWPLSSRSNTGQLSRSTDGGKSFRLLLDLTCAARSRPNCLTGGGGDTENEVSPSSGTLYFADQESLGQESTSSSVDHGDSFPAARQFAVTNGATGVDRQWIAATDDSAAFQVSGQTMNAFLAYHVPGAGQYVQGITQAGTPVPQPVTQLQFVSQSGQMRVDNTDGPGHGWIYQPYRSFLGHPLGDSHYIVATAPASGYQLPTSWQDNLVSDDNPTIFPWLSLDDHGNAYAVWSFGGVMYMSASPIDDRANNPALGGRPGTFWTPQIRVSLPTVKIALFPEVIGGNAGRIGITYDGTTECEGNSATCVPATKWNAYGAVITNALQVGGPAVVSTGVISHRPVHTGNICTSGTSCVATTPAQDRSLLDMTDLGVDKDGRIGVIFTDNNSTMQQGATPADPKQSPFVHFAKLTKGPSLLTGTPNVAIKVDTTPARGDSGHDATWPNVKTAQNIDGLDITNNSLRLKNGFLIGRIRLVDASPAGMAAALTNFNAASAAAGSTDPAAERLQYVLRFSTGTDVYHMSAEFRPGQPLRYFGGKLDANDQLINPANGAVSGAGYHTDAGYHVTGKVFVRDNVIELKAPIADFGFAAGTKLFSVSPFAMAGPSEANELTVLVLMRTVDSTEPFDTTLSAT
jgi:hypothetical protein